MEDIEEWFDAHRVLSHETLSVPTRTAVEWIIERWGDFTNELRESVGGRSCIVDHAGLVRYKIKDLVDELT
jgi:hypothetical protein